MMKHIMVFDEEELNLLREAVDDQITKFMTEEGRSTNEPMEILDKIDSKINNPKGINIG